MIAAYRAAIGDRLAIARKPNGPPWRRRQSTRHSPILARPVRATVATTALLGMTLAVAALARAERGRRATRTRGRRERHFGLLAGEPAAAGLQRMALGQLELAIELLCAESSHSPARAVHETRKAIKRLRALLRLLEDELGSDYVARERGVLDDVADRLARSRDAQVMVDTLDALIRRHPRRLAGKRGVIELRQHLEGERSRAAAATLGGAIAIGAQALADGASGATNGAGGATNGVSSERLRAAEVLTAQRLRVQRWTLSERSAGDLVGKRFREIYREGRRRWRRASSPKAGSKTFHKWRKEAKDLRYAAELLDVRDGGSRRAHKGRHRRLAKLARRADALGETLGEEHDLALLSELVREHEPLRRRKRSRKALLRAIARRQGRLRKDALGAGALLYSRKPNRFMRSLKPF